MTDKTANLESGSLSKLEQEIKRQIGEGALLSTIERRLLREGHPEDEVKRLLAAERERTESKRSIARAQSGINTAKIIGLALVIVGIMLPWSIVAQGDFGLGGASSNTLTGFSPDYLLYGLGFLSGCVLLLVLMLLTRTHYDASNVRDRIVFGLTTFFEALLAAWWVISFVMINQNLASVRTDFELLGPELVIELGARAQLGVGFFGILLGILVLLVVGYLEIAALGGARRIAFKATDDTISST